MITVFIQLNEVLITTYVNMLIHCTQYLNIYYVILGARSHKYRSIFSETTSIHFLTSISLKLLVVGITQNIIEFSFQYTDIAKVYK